MQERARFVARVATVGRASLATVLALVALACGARERPATGVSHGPPTRASASADAGRPRVPTGIPDDFRTAMARLNKERVVSKGHAGERFTVDVYVDPLGKQAILAGVKELPVGVMLVKEHFERGARDGARGPLMMMEKRPRGYAPEHGDWRYVTVSAAGELVQDGPIASCAGCHDEAPVDHVFRVE